MYIKRLAHKIVDRASFSPRRIARLSKAAQKPVDNILESLFQMPPKYVMGIKNSPSLRKARESFDIHFRKEFSSKAQPSHFPRNEFQDAPKEINLPYIRVTFTKKNLLNYCRVGLNKVLGSKFVKRPKEYTMIFKNIDSKDTYNGIVHLSAKDFQKTIDKQDGTYFKKNLDKQRYNALFNGRRY